MTKLKKLPSKGVYKNRVQFTSDSGNVYVISKHKNKLVCSCPSFVFRKVPCKHIKEWRAS